MLRTRNWSNVSASRAPRDVPYQSPWGHDYAWERAVVRKIREGGAAPEVYALYEGAISHETSDRTGFATGYVFHNEGEAAERAAKERAFRASVHAAQEAAKERNAKEAEERKIRAAEEIARRAAAKAARAAEHAKWRKEADERIAEYHRTRPIEIAERVEHASQEHRILSSKWICTVCGGKSFIERKNPGYQITCMSCEKTAWGSHKSLWEVLNK